MDAHSKERLEPAVTKARNWTDPMRRPGLQTSGGQRGVLREKVALHGLDTTHFKRRAWGRPDRPAPTPNAHRALVLLPDHAGRTNRTQLHRALTEVGVPYACESCGNTGERLGRPITLQIDHVNGDRRDNRRDNLRYLCPNCHALTDTWCRQKGRAALAG